MANDFSVRGGANIGSMNASWPFAKVSVSAAQLSLIVFSVGKYNFTPDQIVRLESCGYVPILSKGIRVVHARSDYPAKIVFWCFQNPDRLIEKIQRIGFLPKASAAALPRRDGIPVRWSFILLLALLWNFLFIFDGFVLWNGKPPGLPGKYVLLALALTFTGAVTIPISSTLQSFVLKPGRAIEEIQHYFSLLKFMAHRVIEWVISMLYFGDSA